MHVRNRGIDQDQTGNVRGVMRRIDVNVFSADRTTCHHIGRQNARAV